MIAPTLDIYFICRISPVLKLAPGHLSCLLLDGLAGTTPFFS